MRTLICTLLVLPLTAGGQVPLTTAQIAKKVSPSAVVIEGKTDSGEALGSGFIISKDGKIVTNLHVIKGMNAASVELANGDSFESVSVLATDDLRDLAILKIAGSNLPILELGNSDALNIGEPVVIVGSPKGLEGTVTAGILSSVRDSGDGYNVLQTDAAVNPGNSGGPLVNSQGQAIGVVSFILRSSQGLNFAIPINYVRELLRSLHEPLSLGEIQRKLNAAPGQSSSLKDTLDWLKRTIPSRNTHFVEIFDGWTSTTTKESIVWSLDSCTVELGSRLIMVAVPPNEPDAFHQVEYTSRYTVPVGLVTKAVIERQQNSTRLVRGDSFSFTLSFSTPSKVIRLVTSSNVPAIPTQDTHTDTFSLDFNDESIAHQVMGVFLHASDRCRNKDKEPF